MIINFNKTDIRYLPDIKFLGPQAAVKKYTEIVNKNFSEWDPIEDTVFRLTKLLGKLGTRFCEIFSLCLPNISIPRYVNSFSFFFHYHS